MKENQKLQFWGAAFISAVCFYAFLGSYALMDNNEGLYAGIPLGMVQSGNYILPRLNGLIYIEKPPMLYWLIALNFNLFGISEWTARLVTTSSGFLLGLSLCWFLYRENRKYDAVSTLLVWSSCVGVIVFSRMIFFDMLFSLFFSVLLISLYLFRKNRKKRIWLFLAYTMAAMAVLTKGLLGVALPALTMFVFVYCEQTIKPWYSPRRLVAAIKEMFSYFSITGMIIFFAIALPWHIAAAQQDPEFWYFYFVNEHFLRFLGTRQPEDYYDGPLYYYIVRLFGYMAPWVIFLPAFIWRNKSKIVDRSEQSMERFCWCWFLTVLIFFSISKAKANYYIVAGMPALIMLFAFRIREAKEFIYTKFMFIVFTVAFCLLPLAIVLTWLAPTLLAQLAPAYLWAAKLQQLFIPVTQYLNNMTTVLIITMIFSFTGLFTVLYIHRNKLSRNYYIWLLAASTALVNSIIISQFYLFENNYSAKNIVAEISEAYPKQDIDLYMYNDFEEISTTPYYFERPAVIINWNSNDLWYGMHKKEDSKPYKITLENFLKLPKERPIFIFMEKRRLEDFRNKTAAAGYKIWKNYGKRVIFYRDKEKSNK